MLIKCIKKKTESSIGTSRPKPQSSGGPILLPPPPNSKNSSVKPVAVVSTSGFQLNLNKNNATSQANDLLLNLDATPSSSSIPNKPTGYLMRIFIYIF